MARKYRTRTSQTYNNEGFDEEEIQLAIALSASLSENQSPSIALQDGERDTMSNGFKVERSPSKCERETTESSLELQNSVLSSEAELSSHESLISEEGSQSEMSKDQALYGKRNASHMQEERARKRRVKDTTTGNIPNDMRSAESHTWAAIATSLADDWADKQQALLRHSSQNQILELKSMPSRLVDQRRRHPPLNVKSLKAYNETQRESLLAARAYIYEKLFVLAERWLVTNEAEFPISPCQHEAHLTGHHVAAAINALNLPITLQDFQLMMNLGEKKTSTPAHDLEVLTRQSFKVKFVSLLSEARWPVDEVPATQSVDSSLFVRESLPAYKLPPASTPEFTHVITWEIFCDIFDKANLRCEKSGKVW